MRVKIQASPETPFTLKGKAVSAFAELNEERIVGDTETVRAQEAVGLLTSGLGVGRSVTRCDIASAAKIRRRRFEGKHCDVDRDQSHTCCEASATSSKGRPAWSRYSGKVESAPT